MGRPKGSKNIFSKKELRICNFCCTEFLDTPSRIRDNRGKFCSKNCKISYGHTSITRKKMSDNQKGKPAWNKGKIMPSLRMPRGNSGKRINKNGYIVVYVPNHPFAKGSRNNYVLEHRLIMEQKLGRYLTKEEVVHHRNEIRTDNHPDNLMLFPNTQEHLRFHGFYNKKSKPSQPKLP